jgi:hypothetical protein
VESAASRGATRRRGRARSPRPCRARVGRAVERRVATDVAAAKAVALRRPAQFVAHDCRDCPAHVRAIDPAGTTKAGERPHVSLSAAVRRRRSTAATLPRTPPPASPSVPPACVERAASCGAAGRRTWGGRGHLVRELRVPARV